MVAHIVKEGISAMKRPTFTINYWRDGKWYVGRIRGAPGVISQGRSLESLKANICDAYRMLGNHGKNNDLGRHFTVLELRPFRKETT